MGSANPSAVVAAEIAFAKMARDKGQWTAFRDTADKDADHVPAAGDQCAALVKRAQGSAQDHCLQQPGRVFTACDGSYAISTGPWQRPDGSTGTFITLWRQQSDGSYKWVLDFGSTKAFGADAEDGIEAKIADCPARRAQGVSPSVAGETPAQADLREWGEGAGSRKRPKAPKPMR